MKYDFDNPCKECSRDLSSMMVYPIHQHAPTCSIRVQWEKENPSIHPGFHGKEWQEVVAESKRKFYQEANK